MNHIPNLDAMTPEDLMDFWITHHRGTNGLRLGITGKGSRGIITNLANYAANKATAIKERERGRINSAREYESICESIYLSLPESARW